MQRFPSVANQAPPGLAHRGGRMRSLGRLALCVAATVAVSACGGGAKQESPTTQEQPGQYGVYFIVKVTRPTGGSIRSQDGRIDCGTAGTGRDLCSPTSFPWTTTVTLTATPDAGMYFQSWAADCGPDPAPTCTLDTVRTGADKTVLAFFNTAERLGHGNVMSPSLHAPLYFRFLGSDPGAPRCTNCHGANYAGAGIAPSCNACHAAAGWSDWQQNCSFCHGQKSAVTQAGYDFALHPEWAAPPDDVQGRLTGVNGAAAGAHQRHLTGSTLRGPLPCSECHVVPETAIHPLNASLDLPFGPLARAGGASPVWTASTLTCASTWCHGSFRNGAGANPVQWTGGAAACGSCHGLPPGGSHPANGPAGCVDCHSGYTATSVNLATHVNGAIDVACDSCHGFPPPTGAHVTHFGLALGQGSSSYGGLEVLEDYYPNATPTAAPATYAFGCGNCHPLDPSLHGMNDGSTTAKVVLDDGSGTAGLKALNAATASYDATARTCSGVYCHSSGQAAPTYVTTPTWTSTAKIGCAGCHENPPRYASGPAGSSTANSHVGVDDDNFPWGHFGLPMTEYHPQHGQGVVYDYWTGQNVYSDAAPVTCQTCHFETTDPSNTGPGGFYYLDTTGNYFVPNAWNYAYACTDCHAAGNAAAPLGTGKVLPLRHVNGSRDVAFDARTADPGASWVPSPNQPQRPYWITQGSTSNDGWLNTNRTFAGTTVQFDLAPAAYDPVQKTCTNVTCHMSQGNTAYTGSGVNDRFIDLRWGTPYFYNSADPTYGVTTCSKCHRM